jgi:peptidoglycan/LPS O-acetylase OafA/YrhL
MAVDEQFYLVWPLLLGLTGRRASSFLVVVAASLLFRVGWSAWVTPNFVFVLLPSCLDMFAVGALLRLLEQHPRVQQLARGWWVVLAWLAWGAIWAVTHLAAAHTLWLLVYTTVGSAAAFITLNWVLRLPSPERDDRPNVLFSPLLQWVGQRSYGCYLYHLMLPVFYQRVVYRLFATPETRQFWLGPLPTVLLLLPLLLLIAAASWRWLEAPLDRLKNRLAYS